MTTLLKRLDDWFFNLLLCEESEKEVQQRLMFCNKKRSMEMLEEQGLKLLPEGHGAKISKNGVQLVLAYSYREYTHTKYKNTFRENGVEYVRYDPNDEGMEVFTQEWTYYAWDKTFERWMTEGGHRQTCDEASKDMYTKEKVA